MYDFLFHKEKDQNEVVKEGWSWPAFFFTWIWAIFKGLWIHSVATFIFLFFLGFIIGMIEGDSILYWGVFLLSMIIFGSNGNKWWKDNFLHQGFKIVTTISANTGEEAVGIYINRLKNQSGQRINQIKIDPSMDAKVYYCWQCGKALEIIAAYCPFCGQQLTDRGQK